MWPPLRVLGAALVAAGLVVLVHAFVRFVVEGVGTPAPVAPTEHLVVGGLYRYVRNPMYVAVAAIIVGQALVLGRPALLLYAAAFVAVTATFVRVVRGADAARALRRRVRGLPPRGAGLVAATARVAPGRRRRVGRHSERPKPCCDGPTCSRTQRTSGVAASSSLADRAPGLGAVQPRSERVAAGHGQALAAQQVQRADGRPGTRAARARARARRASAPPSARARSPASAAPPCAPRRSRGGCGRADRAPGGRGPRRRAGRRATARCSSRPRPRSRRPGPRAP